MSKGLAYTNTCRFFNLVGNSNAAEGETGQQYKEDALFYDKDYQAAKVQSFIDAGFNYPFRVYVCPQVIHLLPNIKRSLLTVLIAAKKNGITNVQQPII